MEKLLEEIAAIPDVPFLYRPVKDWAKNKLQGSNIEALSLAEDEFALYARIKKGKSTRKIYVISHLDHPGIVFKNKDYGLPLGSVGYDKLGNYDYTRVIRQQEIKPILLRIYSPNGKFQQKATVGHISTKNVVPIISVNSSLPISLNSFGIWDTSIFNKHAETIQMRNADNNAATVIAVKLLLESRHLKNIDLEVIFTYLEEVVQISSMAIAQRGTTPFGKITPESFIINLDPMEIETGETEQNLIRKLKLKQPNYKDGLIIKANDRNLVYGLYFKETNQAEVLLNQGAREMNIPHQQTITCNSTDAKSFSLFSLTPNIATIAIPCRYKHNQGINGEFVPEEVMQRDLDNTLKLLQWGINQSEVPLNQHTLSERLKKLRYGLSISEAEELKRDQVKAKK